MENSEILLKTLEKENKLLKECYDSKIQEQEQKYQELEEKYNNEKTENDELRKELEAIKYSRIYKVMQKIKKIVKK